MNAGWVVLVGLGCFVLGAAVAEILTACHYRERVLNLLRVDPQRWWYARDMLAILGMGPAVLYSALDHLDAAGELEDRWVEQEGHPKRRAYRVAPAEDETGTSERPTNPYFDAEAMHRDIADARASIRADFEKARSKL